MKNFLILFLSIIYLSANAQTFGEVSTSGFETQKSIEKKMDKEIKKGKKKNEIISLSKKINADTLIYTISNNIDQFTVKTLFDIKDSVLEEKYCGFQEYIFACKSCAEKHLKQFIDTYNFREITKNKYLSSIFPSAIK